MAKLSEVLAPSPLVTTTGTQTLSNKTLQNPILDLSGSNGLAGQVPVARGAGLAPVWADSAIVLDYEGRASLRSVDGPSTLIAVVESLGVFMWSGGSTEIDDDETCFATSSGRWLLFAAAWDLISEYWGTEIDQIRYSFLDGSFYSSLTAIAAKSSMTATCTLPGAATGDRVLVTPYAGLPGNVVVTGWVSAVDTVTATISNPSASAITLTPGTYLVTVLKGTN